MKKIYTLEPKETTPIHLSMPLKEKHPDGYVAYPLGLKGAVVGEGEPYEAALADVKSAIEFHVETFGDEALEWSLLFWRHLWLKRCRYIMSKFPVDAPKKKVLRALHALGFRIVREKDISQWMPA